MEIIQKNISDLRPHPKNAEIYGDTFDSELLESIKSRGIDTPLTITKDNIVICGHRRLACAVELNIDTVPTITFESNDELDIEDKMLSDNIYRTRTNEQKTRVFIAKAEIERQRALRRMKAGVKIDPVENFPQGEVSETDQSFSIEQSETEKIVQPVEQNSFEAFVSKAKMEAEEREKSFKKMHINEQENIIEKKEVVGHKPERDPITELQISFAKQEEKKIKGTARDIAAIHVGMSGRSAEKAAKVVQMTDRLKASGQKDQARALTKTLNKSINAAYTQVAPMLSEEERITPRATEKPKSRKTFNATNDRIKWAKWSWNPIHGCKTNCPYCYARDMATGKTGNAPLYGDRGFEPTFEEDQLEAPFNSKIPTSRKNEEGINKVFLVSMGDLMGEWVPQEWIDRIMEVVKTSQQWTYLLLTKSPKRYLKGTWPPNLWMGATADTQARADIALDVFSKLKKSGCNNILFLSCEPLMEAVFLKNDTYDWLIIGGRSRSSGMPAAQPESEWTLALTCHAYSNGKYVYWKENLERPQQYPY